MFRFLLFGFSIICVSAMGLNSAGHFLEPLEPAADSTTLPVGISIGFHGWWWSDKTRASLDVNNLPSYDEHRVLEEWSPRAGYDIPNPEAVQLTIRIKNLGESNIEGLSVQVLYQWKVGPIGDAKKSTWEPVELHDRTVIHYLPIDGSKDLELDHLLVWHKQRSLPSKQWAWALKIICKVQVSDELKALDAVETKTLIIEKILPLIPGD